MMIRRSGYLKILILVILTVIGWTHKSLAQTCYLAAHDDVICPRGEPLSSDVNSAGATVIPGGLDPNPGYGPGEVVNTDGQPLYIAPSSAGTSGSPATTGGGGGNQGTPSTSNGGCGACTITPPGNAGQCNGNNAFTQAQTQIRSNEGCENYCYGDVNGSATDKTCGVGHEMTAGDGLTSADVCTAKNSSCGMPISNAQVCQLFSSDLNKMWNYAVEQAGELGICDQCFIAALTNVIFQLGPGWNSGPNGFKTAWADLMSGNYAAVPAQIRNSAWYNGPGGGARAELFISAVEALPPKGAPCGNSAPTGTTNAPTAK